MNLSRNHTLAEMTFSQIATRLSLDNTPTAAAKGALVRLASDLLEPIREALGGRALLISSGYRSPLLNREVGGATSSAHLDGRAADFVVMGMELNAAYQAIARADLPFDQLVMEFGAWIHVAIPRINEPPRRMLLMKLIGRGYETYDPVRAAPGK